LLLFVYDQQSCLPSPNAFNLPPENRPFMGGA
jgi:hypothetical protein